MYNKIKETYKKQAYNLIKTIGARMRDHFFDIQIIGDSDFPDQGAILAFNHCIEPDGWILGTLAKKRIHFWIQYEGIYDTPRRHLLNTLNQIPIKTQVNGSEFRSSFTNAVRLSKKHLNKQEYIGIFNDGITGSNRNLKLEERSNYTGAAFLSNITKTPIIPVGLWTSQNHIDEYKRMKERSIIDNFTYLFKKRPIKYKIIFGEILEPNKNRKRLIEKVREEQLRLYNLVNKKKS